MSQPTPVSSGSVPSSVRLSGAETLVDEEIEHVELGPGSQLGRYVIVGELGRGGMGIVHAAYDPELDRKVAIKLLSVARERKSSAAGHTRLMREAQAMARLTHPNVVSVHDVGLHESVVFVAMEFVDGVTLKVWLSQQRRGWRAVLDVLCRAGEGLVAAHAAGLVHRDFKPDNVMIAKDGRVLVMDFGLARAASTAERARDTDADGGPDLATSTSTPSRDSLHSQVTREGAVLGTPHYMAPEQHLGLSSDDKTDQFNFSVTLYEALYGQRPFQGKRMTELVLNVTSGVVGEVPARSDVPGWVRRVVVRGLAVEPQQRWPSMSAMLAELRRDPTRARRVVAALGAAALVLAGGFGLQAWDERARSEACEAQGQAIAASWGPTRREAIRAAITGSSISYAADTWQRVAGWLDGYALELSRARAGVCQATEVEHRRSQHLRERSDACLDERRERFEALVGALAEADEAVVQRGVRAAASLPPLSQCTDDAWLADRLPPPEDETTRALVAELGGVLERGYVQISIAHYDEAVALAKDALEQAMAIDYEPIHAEAQLLLGVALNKKGAYAEAEPELERAFMLAGGLGHDEVAAQAAGELVAGVGNALGRHADGLRWAAMGEMALRRTRGDYRLLRAHLLAGRGVILDLSGDYDAAVAAHEQAIALLTDALGPEHPDVAFAYNDLGTALHAKGDYEGALKHFERVLEIRRGALGEDHPDVALALNNVGAAHYSRGDYDAALHRFERALEIRERALGSTHPDVGQSLHNLANLVNKRGDRTRAVEMYERALSIFREHLGPEHANVAATLDNIGLIEQQQGQYERAIARHLAALAIWEKAVGPEHSETATCLVDLARAYLGAGDLDEAMRRYESARIIIEKVHGEAHPDLGRALAGVGQVHLQAGRHAAAVKSLEQALAILEGADLEVAQTAESRFALARALWEREGTRSRSLELARRAQRDLEQGGDGYGELLGEVVAWLAARR